LRRGRRRIAERRKVYCGEAEHILRRSGTRIAERRNAYCGEPERILRRRELRILEKRSCGFWRKSSEYCGEELPFCEERHTSTLRIGAPGSSSGGETHRILLRSAPRIIGPGIAPAEDGVPRSATAARGPAECQTGRDIHGKEHRSFRKTSPYFRRFLNQIMTHYF
jgi:hypothetical protein